MLNRLFRPRPAVLAGRALYDSASKQARDVGFYRDAGAPDTIEGRFELYVLHVVLLVRRLRREGAQAAETSQALFDAFLLGLDDSLREMGVGDLSVGKKMRKLGEAFYGRAKAYDAAFSDPDPPTALAALIVRTLYGDSPRASSAPRVAGYALRADDALRDTPVGQLLVGRVSFPKPELAEPADVAR